MSSLLVTGFPGFIGTRLVRRLLADAPGARVVALVEPRMAERARECAAGLPGGERVTVQPGDITDPLLGVDDATYERLVAETTEIHHLAAIYDLAVPDAIAERVNVGGTQHVLDLARRAQRLERHHYVSTAYVAGWRSGRIYESELAAGQTFKNHYESTKFAAEVLVRNTLAEIPTTVYRPAIVVGDSRTGETQKFDGPYYLLRTISRLHGHPLPQIGSGDAPFNVVPVDFVVDAIAAGRGDAEVTGQTLHLVDPEPMSSAQLMRLLAREYAGREPSYRIPPGMVEQALRLKPVRSLLGGTPRQSIVYLNHPVSFDTTNADALRRRAGLQAPVFGDYVANIVRFFRENERAIR
jgi:thioester reductase-like protein